MLESYLNNSQPKKYETSNFNNSKMDECNQIKKWKKVGEKLR